MNAHIQISQLLLKRFQHYEIEEYQGYINKIPHVFFLDLESSVIDSEKVRLFCTEVNFYGEFGEHKLGENIEKPFGDSIGKILKGNFNQLTIDDYKVIKRFAYFSVLRSKNVLDKLTNNEYLRNKKKNTPDLIMELVNDNNDYSDEYIEILINRTNVDFVIPTNCLIFIASQQILPISPKVALVLRKSISNENKRFDFLQKEILDAESIKKINGAAIGVEKRNRDMIIAKEKQSLVDLAKDFGIILREKKGEA